MAMAVALDSATNSAVDFSIYAQHKVDCHCHVLDPAGFAYAPDVAYRPAGQETGSADYFSEVMAAYGVRHALLVGPNSGYGADNRCLLDAIARGQGRFKGIAVLSDDASAMQLQDLKVQGIVGVAFNFALHGLDHYAGIGPLLDRLAALDMFAQVQVEHDQLKALAPRLNDCGAPLLVDHCGRPSIGEAVSGDGFQALLGLADGGNTTVKLSGFAKFSRRDYPFADTLAHSRALLDAFGPEHCVWASDWPFLKAPRRLDYGPLLQLFAQTVPDEAMRQAILWSTPLRLFGFAEASKPALSATGPLVVGLDRLGRAITRRGGKTIEQIHAEHLERFPEPFTQGPLSADIIRQDRDSR